MTITFDPPERNPMIDELQAAYNANVIILADTVGRLLEEIRERPLYNEKVAPTAELVREIGMRGAQMMALLAEGKTIRDAHNDWQSRTIAAFAEFGSIAARAAALVEKDRLHPASILGKPGLTTEG